MQRLTLSSDQLPAHLDDSARFKLWRDIYTARYGTAEMVRLQDVAFFQHSELATVGQIGLIQSTGTIASMIRTTRDASSDIRDDFLIGFNQSAAPMSICHRGYEVDLTEGNAVLLTNVEAVESHCRKVNSWGGLVVPRALLLERWPHAEDSLGKSISATLPAMRHLLRYARFLLESDEIGAEGTLTAHVEMTLIDLIVLVLGAHGESAELANARGLRAARLQHILSEIKKSFTNPELSVNDVAVSVGISSRYLQDLLQTTGVSFVERVLELRQQRARALLANSKYRHASITTIAHASGFSDISHFNVSFRRRFGMTPSQYRNGSLEAL